MDDLISRQAAIDALEKISEMFPYRIPGKAETYRQYNEAWCDAIDAASGELEKLPAVQPKAHEGHWIGGDGSYICSECNSSPMEFIDTMGASFDAYVETPMNFCPNCGADMRKENES